MKNWKGGRTWNFPVFISTWLYKENIYCIEPKLVILRKYCILWVYVTKPNREDRMLTFGIHIHPNLAYSETKTTRG